MYKQQSQISNRQKLSLKNILNMQLENQFKISTFQPRPKTMYTQRQMKMYQQQRMKVMTDHKLKRSQSIKIHRGANKMSSLDQEQQKIENYKLKHALGRINVLADGNINMNQQQKIGAIYKFLQSLSRTQNFYKHAFTYIYQSFNHFVYCDLQQNPVNTLEYIANKTKNQTIIRLFNGAKHISYKQLTNDLFHSMNKILQDGDMERINTNREFQELEQKLQQKTKLIMTLSKQIQFYQSHPSKDQYAYITELELKISRVQAQLKRTYNNIKQLQDNKQYFQQYNTMLLQRIQDLRNKLYQFQIDQFSNLKQIQKNSQLKHFQNNAWVLKDLIHKGAIRMATMKEQYSKLQAYNQQLLGERSIIAKRAAVGFVQLTPRPNYKKIFDDNHLDITKIITTKFKPTTQQLVTSLIKRFKQFYETYVKTQLKSQLKLQIPQRQIQKHHSKKNPSSPLMKQLKTMNKQLKKTQVLADNVKSTYLKNKEQLQMIEKRGKR